MIAPTLLLISTLFTLPATSLSPPRLVFTLPGSLPSSWFENLAVRPNGLILATRGDAPEIWQIDPTTRTGSLLVSVPGAFNLTGIAEITTSSRPGHHHHQQEIYVFGSSYIPAPFQVEPGSAKVWILQFDVHSSAAPTVSLLAAHPQAGFINGVAAWGPGEVLLSDTEREAVYLMNINTGTYSTPLANMTGINGLQTTPSAGYIYWANHAAQSLSRVPVDRAAVPRGPVEVLAADQSIDDFAIDVDRHGRGSAYIGAMYENKVVEVVVKRAPSSALGRVRTLADNLTGTGSGLCAVAVLGRRPWDRRVLYASVSMGGGSASVVAIDL